jgi:hypothetical protein
MGIIKRVVSPVAASAAAVMLTLPGAAWAQANDYTSRPPSVAATGASGDSTEVRGSALTPRAESDDLPFTGADVAQFTVIGLSALGAGFALRRRSRRIV